MVVNRHTKDTFTMRQAFYILIIVLLATTACKKRTRGTMTVIKDCTGSYLRLDDKDYTIGNEDKLDKFEDGTVVDVVFIKDDKCVSSRVHCMTVHVHEMATGMYRVTKIK